MLVVSAAHATSPPAGQGGSMALEGVFLLSHLLKIGSFTLEETFAQYDQVSRPRVNAVAEASVQRGEGRYSIASGPLWLSQSLTGLYF